MIIVITGPTGVGKTKLSIELAKRYNAEIINGDSVQVYKGLDIGSAKVKEEEKENIPHHLFDIREVDEEYSIYDYQRDCRKTIDDIIARGKNVIIVGGTGLYIKSALYDYTLGSENTKDNYDNIETSVLVKALLEVVPDIDIDLNNRRRVVRALNYYKVNNSSIKENNNGNKLLYEAKFIGLTVNDREYLYKRINDRVDKMIDDGLIHEVKSFYDKGVFTKPLLNAIGYKELYKYFDGEITYDEAISLIKRNSRRYAKRQYTFFNHQFDIKWFNVNFDNFDETINEVINYLK